MLARGFSWAHTGLRAVTAYCAPSGSHVSRAKLKAELDRMRNVEMIAVTTRVAEARAIVEELRKYDESLYNKPRWLVLNKLDMVPAEERDQRVKDFIKRYKWKGPVFQISALAREGLEPLIHAIWDHVAAQTRPPVPEPDPRFVRPAAADEAPDPRFTRPAPDDEDAR